MTDQHYSIRRRQLLSGSLGVFGLLILPRQLAAAPVPITESIRSQFDGRPVSEGRVNLTLPPLAENGNSVSLEVEVESPMTPQDHVRAIYVFADKNPLPDVARFHLNGDSGRARVATRIRLADSQTIAAVAQLNDGTLFSGTAEIIVTLAACIGMV